MEMWLGAARVYSAVSVARPCTDTNAQNYEDRGWI